MPKRFLYSFDIGFQTNSITIGVDDISFEISYIDSNIVEPEIKSTHKGYDIIYRNIYKGTDIKFVLEEKSIKEFIYIKNRDSIKEINMKFNLKNGSMEFDKNKKEYKIFDNDGILGFCLPCPYVVSNGPVKSDKMLSGFVKLEHFESDNILKYSFNHNLVKKYPVVVDPSFIFSTRAVNFSGITYSSFDSQNNMIVTGEHTYEDMKQDISELNIGDLTGSYNILSDDVVFEDDLVLMFPWIMPGNANVTLQRGKEEIKSESCDVIYSSGSTIGEKEVMYTLVKSNIGFNSPGTINVLCTFPSSESVSFSHYYGEQQNFSSQGYYYAPTRGYSVSYKRKFTYLPKITISLPNNIDCISMDLSMKFTIDNLLIKNNSSFKPLKYTIMPYDFNLTPGTDDYEAAGVSSSFTEIPHTINRTSYKYFSSLFDLSHITVPTQSLTRYVAGDFLGTVGDLAPIIQIEKGNLKSFVNKLNVVLRSSVNLRNNSQQEVKFSKPYFCINNDDVSLFKVGASSKDLKNVDLRVSIKPFMSFVLKNGYTFEDYFEYCDDLYDEGDNGYDEDIDNGNIEITENKYGNTSIKFLNHDLFLQNLNGSYTIDGITEPVGYKNLSINMLKNCSLVSDISGRISTFKILKNNEREIIIQGRHRNSLMKSRSFCVLFFDPNEIYFNNLSSDKKIKLNKSRIDDNGLVFYKDIVYDSDIKSGKDNISLYEKRKKFTLTKDINLYTMGIVSA